MTSVKEFFEAEVWDTYQGLLGAMVAARDPGAKHDMLESRVSRMVSELMLDAQQEGLDLSITDALQFAYLCLDMGRESKYLQRDEVKSRARILAEGL